MKEREVMFTDIVSVLEFESYDKINRHLTLGWILLGLRLNGDMCGLGFLIYTN